MDLRRLKHFLAVHDCGSVGEAARRLGISQPALTLSIRALERTLGTPLFVRSSHGTTPNPFGRAFERRARNISTEADRAQDEIRALLGAQRGRVCVGVAPMFADSIVPSAIFRFHDRHPDVQISVIEGSLDRLVPALLSGELDCVFSGFSPRLVSSELACETLMEKLRAFVVTSARNPLAARRRVTPQQAWEAPWALPVRSDNYRARVIDAFARLNLPPPPAALEYSTVSMEKRILRDGHHIGVMSEVVSRDELRSGALRIVPVPELTWEFRAGAIVRSAVPPMPATQQFIAAMRVVCDGLVAQTRQSA